MAVNRKLPEHILVIEISHVLSHFPKCLVRSGCGSRKCGLIPATFPRLRRCWSPTANSRRRLRMQKIIDTGNRDRLY
ncbi:hypothetical protein EV128_11611 [Rhizobium azibense]|nr:hypothetical protein EV128_11611 [Rhizobium azibense]